MVTRKSLASLPLLSRVGPSGGGGGSGRALRLRLLLVLLTFSPIQADFVFPDFNQTTGLAWVGDVGTTNCIVVLDNAYGTGQGAQDVRDGGLEARRAETVDIYTETSLSTNDIGLASLIRDQLSIFGHQDEYGPADYTNRCPIRVRLTPSQPNKRGAMWFADPLPINLGFETLFTFQITDPSTVCTTHRDTSFSLVHHKTCSVQGGDGFAFVLHSAPQGTQAIGTGNSQMGFGDLPNSLAVAFDPWYNSEAGSGDLVVDHISIQSRGTQNNSADAVAMLGRPRQAVLSDGKVHLAKVVYYPELRTEFLEQFSASEALLPFIMDRGENRRLGTFAVFIDEGISENVPIIAIPLNMHAVMDLPQEMAYVGFTASTGAAWEKHDILSWYWCDDKPCGRGSEEKKLFDYHQQSKHYPNSKHDVDVPGEGFGGGGGFESAPIHHLSPNTDPWEVHHKTRSEGAIEGLYAQASLQVPPFTEV